MVYDAVIGLKELKLSDIERVGGKNASLGEMMGHLSPLGIQIPEGFAITTDGFKHFLKDGNLIQKIEDRLQSLDVDDIKALKEAGSDIRAWILNASLPSSLEKAITDAYQILLQQVGPNVSVAVRSSATAEDLPNASFAGQQETFLNVKGISNVLEAVKKVFASLFNDRAIAYRAHHHFPHDKVSISVGIQQMVRSDLGASGVLFTLDTESGFEDVILINASYGLGELIVQGSVNPDEFYVYKKSLNNHSQSILRKTLGSKQQKMIFADNQSTQSLMTVLVPKEEQTQFSLSDADIIALAKQALIIEKHYCCPMDIEWAKDGETGKIYIVQSRPETVRTQEKSLILERYLLQASGPVLIEGRSVGQKIGQGKAVVMQDIHQMDALQPGDVLITDMTDPDWEPVMKRASAIVTNRGGRTCHAAIIARELGIPAVVGCQQATKVIKTGQAVTVSCAEGDTGYVFDGLLGFEIKRQNLEKMPTLPVKIMMTVGNPERAFDFQKLPNEGIGLARLEFVINKSIGIHPKACLEFKSLSKTDQQIILEKTAGYASPEQFYVQKLKEGIAMLGAAFWPKPVIVRLSDFKSNEYANLIGGKIFEPIEENPMMGFRGASRYLSKTFQAAFALECQALKCVREEYGLTNIEIMIPFVRAPEEAKQVVQLLETYGLKRGEKGLRIIMMCEIPSNALLAENFLEYVDGFSIGSNDLTQLTLGLDRDSGLVSHLFDERNPAVKALLQLAIKACKKMGKSISICGQAPSDYPDLAEWLMREGIDSLSLNPDSVIATWLFLAEKK